MDAIFNLVMCHEIELPSQALLEEPIDFPMFNVEPGDVRMYNVLFYDGDRLFWESPGDRVVDGEVGDGEATD